MLEIRVGGTCKASGQSRKINNPCWLLRLAGAKNWNLPGNLLALQRNFHWFKLKGSEVLVTS